MRGALRTASRTTSRSALFFSPPFSSSLQANPDLVAEHKRKLASQSTSAALDANALASQLQQAGLVKKDDKALELAQQFALDKARNKGGDVYEQEVDG